MDNTEPFVKCVGAETRCCSFRAAFPVSPRVCFCLFLFDFNSYFSWKTTHRPGALNSQAALKQRSHVTARGGRTASHFGGRCQFPASHQRSAVQRRDSGIFSQGKGAISARIRTWADCTQRSFHYRHRRPGRKVFFPATKNAP